MPDLTTLGQILAFPAHAKQKYYSLVRLTFFLITLKVDENATQYRIYRVKAHRKICILTPKGQFENLTLEYNFVYVY